MNSIIICSSELHLSANLNGSVYGSWRRCKESFASEAALFKYGFRDHDADAKAMESQWWDLLQVKPNTTDCTSSASFSA